MSVSVFRTGGSRMGHAVCKIKGAVCILQSHYWRCLPFAVCYKAPEFKGKAPVAFFRRKKKSHMSHKAGHNYCSSWNKKENNQAALKAVNTSSSEYDKTWGYFHLKIKSRFKIRLHTVFFFLINSSPRSAAFKLILWQLPVWPLPWARPTGFIYRPCANVLLHVLMTT